MSVNVVAWSLKTPLWEYRLMVIDRFIIIGSENVPAGSGVFSYYTYDENTAEEARERAVQITEGREEMGYAMYQWPMLRHVPGPFSADTWVRGMVTGDWGFVYEMTLSHGSLMDEGVPA